jgi:outer membrane protein assembly factor BamB
MWRHDARHTAACASDLAADLHVQWRRELPAPRPAFPLDLRLCFDKSYEPIGAEGTLFVPSMVTDSVTAIDTRTGAKRWTFYAEAPVRLAPAAAQGRLYFVADDGYLYCVTADEGRFLWKVRGAPEDRKDYRLLGDDRLVSRWPARGGPVVADGVVYFGAGVWPFEGTYVCAVDAVTGKLIWRQDVSFIQDGLIDHSARRNTGLSPLGSLAVVGDKLIVPSGRALPGFLHRTTGEMEPYTTGWGGRPALAKGSWHVAGVGQYLMHSGALYGLNAEAAASIRGEPPPDLVTPEELARLVDLPLDTVQDWIQQGRLTSVEKAGRQLVRAQKPDRFSYVAWAQSRPNEAYAAEHHPRLQLAPSNQSELGVFREPVATENTMCYSVPVNNLRGRGGHWPEGFTYEEIVAYDLDSPRWGLTCQGRMGGSEKLVPWKTARFQELWSLDSELKVHIQAGSRLYAGAPGRVAAIDLPREGGQPAISWTAEIRGTPFRMLAFDESLFVVTEEGSISCFGARPRKATTYAAPMPPKRAAPDPLAPRAADILECSDVREGYCLALGYGSGRLVEQVALQSKLHCIVLEPDPRRADAARRELDARGLYGSRIHVVQGDLSSLELSPYVASLAISEDPDRNGLRPGDAALDRLFPSMRPYGGTVCLELSEDQHDALAAHLDRGHLAEAEIRRSGDLTLLVRAGGLPGAADWTHESGGPGNTFSSDDRRVKPPFGVLWFGSSVDTIFPSWDYTHSRGPMPVVSHGRMFALVAERVHAWDVYTGRLLWSKTLSESPKTASRRQGHMIWQRDTAENFVAAEDGLYIIGETTCLRLDPSTGRLLGEIAIPEGIVNEAGAKWEAVRISGDLLFGSTGHHLLALDRHSGELRWKFAGRQDRLAFAAGDGKVFCVDYWLPSRRRRGENPEAGQLHGLGERSGEPLWQVAVTTPADTANEKTRERFPPLKPHLSYGAPTDTLLLTSTRSTVAGFRGTDGQRLWSGTVPCRNPTSNWSGPEPPIVLPELLITHAGEVYDPQTGDRPPDRLWVGMNTAYNEGGTRGCNRAVGNRHVVALRDAHAAYFDLADGNEVFLRGVRSGCSNSLLPAGGVLNAPNFAHGCTCNWPIFASLALIHMPEAQGWAPRPVFCRQAEAK